ncbi:hypothetical protein ANCCAN_17526 [Ancylostoma caninum]|uniref:SCP domain-containing protein n=1 Tax=Ancylostoma caninum TaxID=29170 RepID=A0A368FWW0_ANCCA|nr:hypothetical protein ANCCAN_17526 [Ancylostoma caninum]
MYRMKYDCNAESYAHQHAGSCNRNRLPPSAMPGYKENIHVLNTVQTTPAGAIQNALATWWSELARFGMRSNMMFYPSEARRGARSVFNWAKMAWWNNIILGCSVQNCGRYYLTVCMYRPGGNFFNQYVYQVGAVCSGCPRGQCDGQALCRW